MAVACAAGFGADQLVFLTDVDGVRGRAKARPSRALSRRERERLIAAGVATGGMQAKLNAAAAALRQGVGEVRIAPGARGRVIWSACWPAKPLGTRMTS